MFIFLLAFAVRALTWHDTRLEVGKVQTAVVADYQRVARLLREGGVRTFFSESSPLADSNNLGHPPGYSLLIALVYSWKESDAGVQFVQLALDAFSDVLIFLIVAELLPLNAALVAGLLAALSPQLAWNSVLLLPDSISVLPSLLAIFLLARALRNPRFVAFIAIGAIIGISCWLRANTMLLTLFFAAAVWWLMKGRPLGRGAWRFALAVIFGTVLVVLPLTIRNAIVFHRFIPLSLGAGQTLLEGIADYDKAGTLGVPSTDIGVMKQEAEIYQRPEYYGTLFNPDGVERERARLVRGFAIVRAHPFWFAGVMARRASSMLRLERSRLISTQPAITHSLNNGDRSPPAATFAAQQIVSGGVAMPGAAAILNPDGTTLLLMGNGNKYGRQFAGPEMTTRSASDYVATVPVRVSEGRMRVSVENSSGKVYASQIIEPLENTRPADQPSTLLELPFVALGDDHVRVVWDNEASTAPQSSVEIGTIELRELGPARYVWTRYPRFIIHAIQKLFLTAVILPLALAGLLIMVLRKQSTVLVILSIVPIYFFTVQSAVHTEYRYVLAVDYFLFAFAGVAVWRMGSFVKNISPSLWERVSVRAYGAA
jgi:hypothetical protein